MTDLIPPTTSRVADRTDADIVALKRAEAAGADLRAVLAGGAADRAALRDNSVPLFVIQPHQGPIP